MSRKACKKSPKILIIGYNLITILFFSTWLSAANDPMKVLEVTKYKEKKKAPDFTLKNLDGQEVTLSSFVGKIVLLNFWATWCIPCRKEMPAIDTLYQEFKDEGLVVLAIDYQETSDKIKAFLEETKVSFPILLDSEGKTTKDYGVRGLPTSYLIDKEGFLIGWTLGDRDWASEDARKLVKNLLK